MKRVSLLRKVRKDKGLTLEQVELLSGIPHSLLSQIENGQRSIDVERAQQLAKIYKVPLDNIFEPIRFSSKNLNVKDA